MFAGETGDTIRDLLGNKHPCWYQIKNLFHPIYIFFLIISYGLFCYQYSVSGSGFGRFICLLLCIVFPSILRLASIWLTNDYLGNKAKEQEKKRGRLLAFLWPIPFGIVALVISFTTQPENFTRAVILIVLYSLVSALDRQYFDLKKLKDNWDSENRIERFFRKVGWNFKKGINECCHDGYISIAIKAVSLCAWGAITMQLLHDMYNTDDSLRNAWRDLFLLVFPNNEGSPTDSILSISNVITFFLGCLLIIGWSTKNPCEEWNPFSAKELRLSKHIISFSTVFFGAALYVYGAGLKRSSLVLALVLLAVDVYTYYICNGQSKKRVIKGIVDRIQPEKLIEIFISYPEMTMENKEHRNLQLNYEGQNYCITSCAQTISAVAETILEKNIHPAQKTDHLIDLANRIIAIIEKYTKLDKEIKINISYTLGFLFGYASLPNRHIVKVEKRVIEDYCRLLKKQFDLINNDFMQMAKQGLLCAEQIYVISKKEDFAETIQKENVVEFMTLVEKFEERINENKKEKNIWGKLLVRTREKNMENPNSILLSILKEKKQTEEDATIMELFETKMRERGLESEEIKNVEAIKNQVENDKDISVWDEIKEEFNAERIMNGKNQRSFLDWQWIYLVFQDIQAITAEGKENGDK